MIQPATNNLYCTKESTALYTIGCAPGDSYATCIQDIPGNLYHGLDENRKKKLTFRFNDEVRPFDSIDPEKPPIEMTCPVGELQTNEDTTPKCTVSLPTGVEIAMLVATNPDQYQIVYDPIPQDTEAPMASITGSASGITFQSDTKTLSSTDSAWINTPVTATIRCVNTTPENNDTCTCAWLVKADYTGSVDKTDW